MDESRPRSSSDPGGRQTDTKKRKNTAPHGGTPPTGFYRCLGRVPEDATCLLPAIPRRGSPGTLVRSANNLLEILATTEAEAAAAAPADARDDPMACDDAPAAADETDDSPRSVMAEAIDVGGSQQPRMEPAMSWPPPQPVRHGAGSWEKWQKWQALASNRSGGVLPPATYSTSPGDWAQHTSLEGGTSMMR